MSRHSGGVLAGTQFTPFDVLQARARRAASGLAALGIGPGDCAAILMRNDTPFLEISYAAQRLGAYAVPLNWHFKLEEIAYILADCRAKALFGHDDLISGIVPYLPAGLPVFCAPTPAGIQRAFHLPETGRLPGALDYESWLGAHPEHDGPPLPAPMSMIYTSGTTGRPKGVRRMAPTAEQAEGMAHLRALAYGVRPNVRAAVPGPLYHSAPNTFALGTGLIGDLVVLIERFDAERLLALIEREAIDTIFMVPTMFIRLLKLPEATRRRYDVSSLRHVIHAAAPCPPAVKQAIIEWFGPVVWEFYGSTESGPVSLASSADALLKPGTVGRATPGTTIRILDEAGRPLPAGEIGEIFSRIPAYAPFVYHNAPDKRAEVERDGFITCGDLGYLDADGYLFICDRKRDMVISGGVNIYPAEIEHVLHGMPGVHDCAVFGIPDAEYGEALIALVEPREGAALTPEAIRAHLADHLAGYKVPRQIEIRQGLPREDSGKIFKRRLRDPYWEAAGRRI